MRLDRNTRERERPRFSQAADDGIRVETAPFGLKKSERRFQDIHGGGPSKGGKISGKNVGASGAPVYALTKSQYGPVWVQGFNPAKLPNGTKIATLPQFKKDIRG